MKSTLIFPISLFTVLLLTTSGCEDIVEVQTADAPRQVVVDAWLTNVSEDQEIKLTYSQPYFNPDFAEAVTGAEVTITSDDHSIFSFEEVSAGRYIWQPQPGEKLGDTGDFFEFTVHLPDQVLTASSTMHPVPVIDSIRQEYRDDDLRGPDGIYTQFFARDLEGLGNTYWIKSFKNDQYLNKPEEINLAFDAGFDGGSQLDGIIFIPPIRELTNPVPDEFPADEAPYQPGDRLRVEIHSISLEAFQFLQSARDQILNGSNTIFASPVSNSRGNIISDKPNTEVLGVFCVSAVESLEKQIE
jgi:hypothetical protein